MTDTSSPLKALGAKLKAGLKTVQNANEQAKARAEGRPLQGEENPAVDDLEDNGGTNAPKNDERLSAVDDQDLEDGIIIEGEAQPAKPKRKGLNTKQKLLFLGAMAIAAVWVMKNKDSMPLSPPTAQTEVTQGSTSAGESTVDSPAFDFGKEPEPDAPIEVASSGAANTLGFGTDEAPARDPANSPLGSEAVTADLNEQFATAPAEATQTLDPFSGEVKTTPATPTDLPAKQSANTSAPTTPHLAKPQHPTDASAELALIGADATSPFSGGDSNSTELSGTKTQNPDSKAGVLQDQGAKAEVANLKAKIAEKDGRIGTLESQVSKLNNDLAAAKASKNHQGQSKAPASKSPPKKAAQPAHTPQRSPSTQRAATAQKVVARPQVCVTAVAQAARNCTTCVPHAFITHRGSETMVGQGDFIEGLRVNIVGDRLDLQNAEGVVVHKFWSSRNGCSAG